MNPYAFKHLGTARGDARAPAISHMKMLAVTPPKPPLKLCSPPRFANTRSDVSRTDRHQTQPVGVGADALPHQGLPFAVVNSVSVIVYKASVCRMPTSHSTLRGFICLVIKAAWSPVVDILRTRRWWIWTMQLIMGAGFAGVGLTLPLPMFFQTSLIIFYLVAFASATHDIAADGYYLLATTEKEQAFYVGIRSTFFRVANIFGQGLLVITAGVIQSNTGLPKVNVEVAAKPGTAMIQMPPFRRWQPSPQPMNSSSWSVPRSSKSKF